MNKDRLKGTAEKVKGKVNEAVGKATGNPKREVKGEVQQAAGEARKNLATRRNRSRSLTDSPRTSSCRMHSDASRVWHSAMEVEPDASGVAVRFRATG